MSKLSVLLTWIAGSTLFYMVLRPIHKQNRRIPRLNVSK